VAADSSSVWEALVPVSDLQAAEQAQPQQAVPMQATPEKSHGARQRGVQQVASRQPREE
jgi:hypothetical protein